MVLRVLHPEVERRGDTDPHVAVYIKQYPDNTMTMIRIIGPTMPTELIDFPDGSRAHLIRSGRQSTLEPWYLNDDYWIMNHWENN